MTDFPGLVRPRPRQRLVARGLAGAATQAAWDAVAAEPIDWEGLFANTGLFGIEIGAAAALAGCAVELHGFMSPPMDPAANYFVLTRSPMPDCPFCAPTASWPDDIVVVRVPVPGVDVDDPLRPVMVRGWLDLGEQAGPVAGMTTHARLTDAVWRAQ